VLDVESTWSEHTRAANGSRVFLAPEWCRQKPQSGVARTFEHGCPLCEPNLHVEHPDVRQLPTGGWVHTNLWPLSRHHAVVTPDVGHVEDPNELDERGWTQLLRDVFCAMGERPRPVVAGATMGPGSSASLPHLHAQVLAKEGFSAYEHERGFCATCGGAERDDWLVRSFGLVDVVVPRVGLESEVIVLGACMAEPDEAWLSAAGEAVSWVQRCFLEFGQSGTNIAFHADEHAHLHMRPSPQRLSGLEDASGETVIRWCGEAFRDRFSEL
jgi:hypothetical protein